MATLTPQIVTPAAIWERLDKFETNIRLYVDETVDERLKAIEPDLTMRVIDAVITRTAERVTAMLTEDETRRSLAYEAALEAALRKMTETHNAHSNQMTISYAQMISQFESRVEPKMQKVIEAGGKVDTLVTLVREYRQDHDKNIRRLDDKYTTIVTQVADSDTRIREAVAAYDRKTNAFINEFRITLATFQLAARAVKAGVTSGGFWKLVGIVTASSSIGSILVTLFKVIADFVF